jgi:hypothetical protein
MAFTNTPAYCNVVVFMFQKPVGYILRTEIHVFRYIFYKYIVISSGIMNLRYKICKHVYLFKLDRFQAPFPSTRGLESLHIIGEIGTNIGI